MREHCWHPHRMALTWCGSFARILRSSTRDPLRPQTHASVHFLNHLNASCIGREAVWASSPCLSPRRFRAVSPIMMGRRSAKIALKKGKADGNKAKLYGKVLGVEGILWEPLIHCSAWS